MKKFLCLLAAMAMLSTLAVAQTTHADIYGKVILQDGSAIPGVLVTLTGEVIGTKTTVTSEEGNYRFLRLPAGEYEAKFELEGFKTVIRKGIRLYLGKSTDISVTMETTTLKEEVVVVAKANVIDTRKTLVGVNVSAEMIQSLPTARNPWTIMSLVPGMMLDRPDVGGAESGQQSYFYGGGVGRNDANWNVDGANITDNSALGAAPAYLNMNAYEELQVTMASNDITAMTGGVQLNFVTKRAGNRYSGDFHLYVEQDDWELGDNPHPDFDEDYVSPGINRLYQYGINFGGPIIKDKWWFFGSWTIQDIHSRTITGSEDATWLASAYGKMNFQIGNTSGDAHLTYDNKLKWNRAAWGAASQAATTMWNQTGPSYVYYVALQQVMGNLMLHGKFGLTDGGFQLDCVGTEYNESLGIVEGYDWWTYYYPSRYRDGAIYDYKTNRNQVNMALDGNYFAEGVMGGDHEIRFGIDYIWANTTSQTLYPQQRMLYRMSDYAYFGVPNSTDVFEPNTNGAFDVILNRISFYLSDTATFGKLTVNLGIRWDQESGKLNEGVSPAFFLEGGVTIPEWEPYLGRKAAPAMDSPAKWTHLSPRLSFTYDITGDGKNVVKLSAARYFSQVGNGLTGLLWTAGVRYIGVPWDDKNNDKIPQIGEFTPMTPQQIDAAVAADWTRGYFMWYAGFDPSDPTKVTSSNKFDPDYSAPITDELVLSYEKSIFEDFAVSVTGFYKRHYNQSRSISLYADGSLDDENSYAVKDTDPETGQDIYKRVKFGSIGTYRTNYEERYETFYSLQLHATKKLSNGYMFELSFTWLDYTAHLDPSEVFDKTNFSYSDGGVVAPGSGGSGLTGIYVNARWMCKINGLVQLPFGINFTGVLDLRDGYVYHQHDVMYKGNAMYYKDKKAGDTRLPTYYMLNLGLEKTFKVSDTATATLFVDGYNITNNNVALKVETTIGPDNGKALKILNKGIFQFGFRLNF